MKRIIDHFLWQWKQDDFRKPLLIRGARQVGKTYSVRNLGASYADFAEINLEFQADAQRVFEKDLDPDEPAREISPVIHSRLLGLLGEYLALGGMSDVVQHWINKKDLLACTKIHHMLLNAYRQDFAKYARKLQIKYVELMFNHIPTQLGRKFKYSLIEGDYRKRELAPALELVVTAGVAHKVYYSAGQEIPFGAQINPRPSTS